MHLVTEYLRSRSFADLKRDMGVKVRPSTCGSKFSLNYCQISSDPVDLLHRECRGLIVRPGIPLPKDDWENRVVGDVSVIAYPLSRFFNFGDSNAANVDWADKNLRVYEKLDGTMCVFYFDNHKSQWCVGTRAVSEADLLLNDSEHTFYTLFMLGLQQTLGVSGSQRFISYANKSLTYVFELTSPFNRVVVNYPATSVTLLAVRELHNGLELDHVNEAAKFELPVPKTWTINDPHALTLFVDDADPTKLEGAVVCDSSFRRVKVKNKTYVTVSRSKDILASRRNVLELIIAEKLDDVLIHLEESFVERLTKIQDDFRYYLKQVNANFRLWSREAETRKDFAKFVIEFGDISQVYFSLWEKKQESAEDWFKSQHAADRVTTSLLDAVLKKMYGNLHPEVVVTPE